MSTLDDLNAGPGGMAGFVSALSRRLRPVSRRDVLVGATVAATALATKPREYALAPVAAYATICGPGTTASSGWTVFCATVNNGVNTCPPGSFAAGWWKAADSSWCGGGYRYIVDCNATCSKCTTGCSDNMCDSRCWSCSCGRGSTATCDQRRVCCNAFRYGQCNTQLKCSGGVHCRVVSCVAPYQWTSCTTTSLVDNRTAEHSAPSLPQWSAIAVKYRAMGEQGSYLKASTGPERAVGDGRGRFVNYQGGAIYYSTASGAHPIATVARAQWDAAGGPRGALGYPRYDYAGSLVNGGWVQIFEHGAIADSASTTPQTVFQPVWSTWAAAGRETGGLGYPTGPRTTASGGMVQPFQRGVVINATSKAPHAVYGGSHTLWVGAGRETGELGFPTAALFTANGGWSQGFERGSTCDSANTTPQLVLGDADAVWASGGRQTGVLGFATGPRQDVTGGWIQFFQHGVIASSDSNSARGVWATAWTVWSTSGRESGVLGFPISGRYATADSGYVQLFEDGAIADSAATAAVAVAAGMYTAWVGAGREVGVLGYPTAAMQTEPRGRSQSFAGGQLWALGSGSPHTVYGNVLKVWQLAGGATGRFGYPLTDTTPTSDGRHRCTFEGRTIVA